MEQNKLFFNSDNNFQKKDYIKSDLIYGDKKLVQRPFITIAIPTYKREILLKQAIDSAIYQISPIVEYEIIIVDNESIDTVFEKKIETETERLVKTYNNPRILYYRNSKNIGMFGNFNRCIELARGEWVAFLHDDDVLDKSYVNRASKLVNRKKQIGAILSNFKKFKGDTKPVDEEHYENSLQISIRKFKQNKLMRLRQRDSQIMGNIYGAPTCGSIFRKDYLMNTGGFNENHYPSEDWFFLFKFSGMYKVYKTNSSFGYYRVSNNESLNPTTLKKFILQAIQFRKYLASKTILGKVLERLFDNERYFQTLRWVKDYDKNSEIEFDQITNELGFYYRPIMSRVFKGIQNFYWYSKRIIALFVG